MTAPLIPNAPRPAVLLALAALALVPTGCPTARGDDAPAPKKYYLIDGRVESAEKRIADLEKRVAELEKLVGAKTVAPAPKSIKAICVCGDDCECAPGECPAKCPTAAASRVRPLHISPDGTVNELHPDGVYRPIPGVAKKAEPPAVKSFTLPVSPVQSGCPGGVCPVPSAPRRGLFGRG